MIEKRFRVINHDDYELDYITDNNKRMHIEDVCDLLNNLVNENEQLKQQLKTKVIVNRQYEELQRVKKENEELKGEVAHYKLILMSLEQQAKRMSSIRRNMND